MKLYKKPVVEITVFEYNNIIATSYEFPETVQNTGWVKVVNQAMENVSI